MRRSGVAMSSYLTDDRIASDIEQQSTTGKRLFDRIGGRATLDRVHKIFYDKIYAHDWLGRYFQSVSQAHVESQQSDFMSHLMGGPKSYSGRMPIDAHMHIYITDELFAVRHDLLAAALVEAEVPTVERGEWLKIDMAFKKVLLKPSLEDCKRRYATDEILAFADPTLGRKAS